MYISNTTYVYIIYTSFYLFQIQKIQEEEKNQPRYWCLKDLMASKDLFLNDFVNNFLKTALLLTQPHLYQIVGEQ